jgi:hypothetical protein
MKELQVRKEEFRKLHIPFIGEDIEISRYIFDGGVGVKFTLSEGNENFPLGASLLIASLQNGEGVSFVNNLYHSENMIMKIMEPMEKIYRLKHISNLYISFVISPYSENPTKLEFDANVIKDTKNKPKFKDLLQRKKIWAIGPVEMNHFWKGLEKTLKYV